jgi:nucleoid-associated protein YgaU
MTAQASIRNIITGEVIKCFFNPNEYALAKQNKWEEKTAKGEQVPHMEFSGGGPISLKLQLLFDSYEDHDGWPGGGDVRAYTRGLWRLMEVEPGNKNPKTQKGEPSHCRFEWGDHWAFEAVIESISEKFTLFRDDGTPVRALVDVSFKQIKDESKFPGQNPTSGGSPGDRLHTVRAGETLAGIAYEAYGDATVWRCIADANALDDPRKLRPGMALLVPALPTL